MGCTQTKIENEEAVTRCKERKELMKSAVSARNAFASHHSAYAIALKDTGAALSDFAQGEVDHNLHSSSQPPPAPVDPLPPPPPPPLIRAVSMPELVIPQSDAKPDHADTIREEEEEDDDDDEMEAQQTTPLHHLARRRGRPPHDMEPVPPPPVSPPRPQPTNPTPSPPPPPPPDPKESTTWEYFFSGTHDMLDPSLTHHEQIRHDFGNTGYSADTKTTETVEVHESNYGYAEKLKRTHQVNVDIGASTSSGATSSNTTKVETHVAEKKVIETEVVKPLKKVKQVIQPQPSVPSNVSLVQILNDLDDKFLKASQSASQVSKILEANRMHYHSNFADNRGHIDHSARLMRVITWNRSIRGLQNPNDANDDEEDTHESLASVLDKLLAWEKKLYDEVKAGELMKIEYQKKVAVLNKRKKHNTNAEALERAKAAVSHLHTRYIVDIQSMDSTVSEIAHLRDDHLYPKLVLLVEGMARMWETMNLQHRAQVKIVEDLKALDVNDAPSETTEDHHKRTIQLRGIADVWHTHFQKLMSYQKDYIIALSSWLKLNLIPIESNIREKVSSPPRVHRPPIHTLLHDWRENLERLPDELARSAILSFAAIMKNIMVHQEDEVKLKMKCEDTKKELARKTRTLDDKYQKYMERRVPPDGVDPERSEDIQKDPLGELQLEVEILRQRLKDEQEQYQKHCRQVREKSLASLKIHLPELFRALSDFAYAASSMYKKLLPPTHS